MKRCMWCRVEYCGSALFHVCADGTNFSERLGKNETELHEEYQRQDRLKAGYKAMESTALVQYGADAVHPDPSWPFVLNNYDIELLDGMKIKR